MSLDDDRIDGATDPYRHDQRRDRDVYDDNNNNLAEPISHNEIAIHTASHEIDQALYTSPTASVLNENALKAGYLTKRGYRVGCVPAWKRRYFILKGQYLFKFESPVSTKPKGVPIPVMSVQCSLGPIDPSSTAAAAGHKATMTLTTLRKDYVVGAESSEILQEWIQALSHARTLAIKQDLGHAPITHGEAFANRSGDYLTEKRLERETVEAEETRRGRYEGP